MGNKFIVFAISLLSCANTTYASETFDLANASQPLALHQAEEFLRNEDSAIVVKPQPKCSVTPMVGNVSSCCDTMYSAILGRDMGYCMERTRPDLPALPNQEPVVYFMHGITGNQFSWFASGFSNVLDDVRKSHQSDLKPMTFVSFETTFESFFVDAQQGAKPDQAYETWFDKEFFPKMTQQYHLCHERRCLGVAGYSMGGYGALKAALKHPELFSVVATEEAALPPFSIFDTNSKWVDYFKGHTIGVILGMALLFKARNVFGTEDWYKTNDPIMLAEALPLGRFPAVYMSVGGKDDFGFDVGFWRMKELLDRRQVRTTTHFEPDLDHQLHRNQAMTTEMLLFLNSSF